MDSPRLMHPQKARDERETTHGWMNGWKHVSGLPNTDHNMNYPQCSSGIATDAHRRDAPFVRHLENGPAPVRETPCQVEGVCPKPEAGWRSRSGKTSGGPKQNQPLADEEEPAEASQEPEKTEEELKALANVRCLYCNTKGHYTSKCPLKTARKGQAKGEDKGKGKGKGKGPGKGKARAKARQPHRWTEEDAGTAEVSISALIARKPEKR